MQNNVESSITEEEGGGPQEDDLPPQELLRQHLTNSPRKTREIPSTSKKKKKNKTRGTHRRDADSSLRFTPYMCKHCRKTFHKRESYKSHLKIHSDETYRCDICRHEFQCKKYLQRHVRNVHDEDKKMKYKCPHCDMTFPYGNRLENHIRVHTGEKPYKCEICGRAFSARYSYKTHMLMHTDEKPFKCSFCPYCCRDSSTLRRHQERHMGITQSYQCKKCDKIYKSRRGLQNHVAEVHLQLDALSYECDVCRKRFKHKYQVYNHKKYTHDSKEGNCELCGKYFRNMRNISQHMMTHSELRPWRCEVPDCLKRFKTKDAVKRHEIIHFPERQFECDHCGFRFSRRHRLVAHLLIHAKGRAIAQTRRRLQIKPELEFEIKLEPREFEEHELSDVLNKAEVVDAEDIPIEGFQSDALYPDKVLSESEEYDIDENKDEKFESDVSEQATEPSKAHKVLSDGEEYDTEENKDETFERDVSEQPKEPYTNMESFTQDALVKIPEDVMRTETSELTVDPPNYTSNEETSRNENEAQSWEVPTVSSVEVPVTTFTKPAKVPQVLTNEVFREQFAKPFKTTIRRSAKVRKDMKKLREIKKDIAKKLKMSKKKAEVKILEKIRLEYNDRIRRLIEKRQTSREEAKPVENIKMIVLNKHNNTTDLNRLEDNRKTTALNRLKDDNNTIDLNSLEDDNNRTDLNKLEDDSNTADLNKLEDDSHTTVLNNLEGNNNTTEPNRLEGDSNTKDVNRLEDDNNTTDLNSLEGDSNTKDVNRLEDDNNTTDLNSLEDDNNTTDLNRLEDNNKSQASYCLGTSKQENYDLDKSGQENCSKDINNQRNSNQDLNKNENSDQGINEVDLDSQINNDRGNSELDLDGQITNDQGNSELDLDGQINNDQGDSELGLDGQINNDQGNSDLDLDGQRNNYQGNNELDLDGQMNNDQDNNKVDLDGQINNDQGNNNELDHDGQSSNDQSNNNEVLDGQRNNDQHNNDLDLDGQQSDGQENNNEEEIEEHTEIEDKEDVDDETWGEVDAASVENQGNKKIKFNTAQCYVCFKLFESREKLLKHCQEHFDVCNDKILKKCPLCPYVTSISIYKHALMVHKVKIHANYGKIIKKDTENERYAVKIAGKKYYERNEDNSKEINEIEVIPSVGNLNKHASMEIDRKNRESKAKVTLKSKLVKKGNEWVVCHEKVNLNLKDYIVPEFDEIRLQRFVFSTDNTEDDGYVEKMIKLRAIVHKHGYKMVAPCDICDKICLNIAALKAHRKTHEVKPPKPRKRKNKMAKRKKSKNKTRNIKKKKDPKHIEKTKLDMEDPNKDLKEFYKNNINGNDMEYEQFLEIFKYIDKSKSDKMAIVEDDGNDNNEFDDEDDIPLIARKRKRRRTNNSVAKLSRRQIEMKKLIWQKLAKD